MKTLSESLLSDFDTLEKKSESEMYLQYCYKMWCEDGKHGKDVYGRSLKVGDLVIGIAAYQPVPSIIVDIKNKKIAVSQTGDCSDIKNTKGELVYDYQPSYEFLKITPEILKAIYFTK